MRHNSRFEYRRFIQMNLTEQYDVIMRRRHGRRHRSSTGRTSRGPNSISGKSRCTRRHHYNRWRQLSRPVSRMWTAGHSGYWVGSRAFVRRGIRMHTARFHSLSAASSPSSNTRQSTRLQRTVQRGGGAIRRGHTSSRHGSRPDRRRRRWLAGRFMCQGRDHPLQQSRRDRRHWRRQRNVYSGFGPKISRGTAASTLTYAWRIRPSQARHGPAGTAFDAEVKAGRLSYTDASWNTTEPIWTPGAQSRRPIKSHTSY